MDALLARLESANEGSRELDVAIEIATQRCDPTGYLLGDELHWNEPHEFGSTVAYEPLCQPLPHYTTSLDAALTLVPEGKEWGVDFYSEKKVYFEAAIGKPGSLENEVVVEAP